MKKSWWKVSVYCIAASWVCFQMKVRFLGRWAIVTLPDGSISMDNTRWMIGSAVLFLAIVCIGGFFLFRKMTRKEIFCSASVLVAFNIVAGLIAYKMQGMASMYFVEFTDWASFLSNLLFPITQNAWIPTVIGWILPPYIFLLFGKKEAHTN